MKELIFGLIGGTALLMYGVDKMGTGLEKASGEMMRKILSVLTGKVWSAFLVGTFLTALVQSSTAITVLTIGFVNAGLMKLPQAIGIIYGANIGTTITAQLMAFSFRLELTDIALPVLGVGFAISLLSKNKTPKNFGDAVMGFGMMFLGLRILNSGVPFMQSNETLRFFFLNYASVPWIAILLGIVATAAVHSSAATVGLVMVLGQAGLLDLSSAICVMFGDNIGTCITAQLASVQGNVHARRTAWAHTLYNIIGVLIAWILLPWFTHIVAVATDYFQPGGDIAVQIANSHTIFNIFSAVVFLPLTKYYVKFLETVIRDREEDQEVVPVFTDRLLLDTPIAAIKAAIAETARTVGIARRMFEEVMEGFYRNDPAKLDQAERDEETLNDLQRQITQYIIELSKRPLSYKESASVPTLIRGINNVERIGDHSLSLSRLAHEKMEKNLVFSSEAIRDLREIQDMIFSMFDLTVKALETGDKGAIAEVANLESRMDGLSKRVQEGHAKRLEDGRCTVESGLIFLDVVNYLERIADHIYKVCEALGGLTAKM
ncbi:MAG TPA: Na/Pi cotransporter family protein [Firmicutes bacterium]|nr:Na/Pi cotransporter family protein [Candidatus Fermentithermobacillaceae bacterium]